MKIGVVSDTHNLLRPEVLAALSGSDLILHAGDICRPEVLRALEAVAPVLAVRGNCDGPWAQALPLTRELEVEQFRVCMAHRRAHLPAGADRAHLAVFGHTHRYQEERRIHPDGRCTLYLNPGSCGPGLLLPVTLAEVRTDGGQLRVSRIHLRSAAAEKRPADLYRQIEWVMADVARGRSVQEIAEKRKMAPELTGQIVRLILTHPGVTTDGIMTKMGL